jgi:hypothetical protein
MSLISALTNWRTLALLVVFASVFCLVLVACHPIPSNSNPDDGKLSADTQVTLMTALQANLAKFDAQNCDGTCVLAGTIQDLQVSYHSGH